MDITFWGIVSVITILLVLGFVSDEHDDPGDHD